MSPIDCIETAAMSRTIVLNAIFYNSLQFLHKALFYFSKFHIHNFKVKPLHNLLTL